MIDPCHPIALQPAHRVLRHVVRRRVRRHLAAAVIAAGCGGAGGGVAMRLAPGGSAYSTPYAPYAHGVGGGLWGGTGWCCGMVPGGGLAPHGWPPGVQPRVEAPGPVAVPEPGGAALVLVGVVLVVLMRAVRR